MGSYYSVVQYAPDPAADERINFGVLAFAGANVRAHFLSNWKRVRAFSTGDIDFLQAFAEEIEEVVREEQPLPGLEKAPPLNEETVRKMAETWSYAIRLTPPRFSVKSPEELAEFAAAKFLVEPETPARPRPRQTAAKLARTHVNTALKQEIGDLTEQVFKGQGRLTGKLEEHPYDLVLRDGQLLLGAQGFSFEAKETKRLVNLFEAILYALEDVRERNADLPLAMVALPPKGESELYPRAREVFEKMNVSLVPEVDVEEWAGNVAQEVEDKLAPNGAFAD